MENEDFDIPLPMDYEGHNPEKWLSTYRDEDDDGGWFAIAYRYLRYEIGMRPGHAFLASWLSVRKDDRGSLHTYEDVANMLGVTRKTLHHWKIKYKLEESAEQLRIMRMRGDRIGEVDWAVYQAAINPTDGKAADRRLFYERAGVLNDQLTPDEQRSKNTADRVLRELNAVGAFEDRT